MLIVLRSGPFFEFILALKKKTVADLQIAVFSDNPGLLGPHFEVNELGSFPYDHHKSLLASSGYWLALVPLSSVEDPEFLPFHICKCPIKYLDYGMASIPAIFSDAYIYQQLFVICKLLFSCLILIHLGSTGLGV